MSLSDLEEENKRLKTLIDKLNSCPWCGQEMERLYEDGGVELGCTNERCLSFGVGVWCYADYLLTENSRLKAENAMLGGLLTPKDWRTE